MLDCGGGSTPHLLRFTLGKEARYPLYKTLGLRAGLDGCRKPRPTRIRSPGRQACTESLYRLRYPGPHAKCKGREAVVVFFEGLLRKVSGSNRKNVKNVIRTYLPSSSKIRNLQFPISLFHSVRREIKSPPPFLQVFPIFFMIVVPLAFVSYSHVVEWSSKHIR